jgi:anti-anti-sigma factor
LVVSVEVADDVTRLVLAGEVDFEARPGLRRLVMWCSTSTVLIDLRAVTFLDAAGIGALVHLAQTCLAHGRAVQIVEPSPPAMRALQLTNLSGALDGRWT